MAEQSDPVHLNNHHRDTLVSIFLHPTSHNIDWKAVISLLSVVGTVDETPAGKFHVTLGSEELVLTKPRNKDVDVQTVVDLRRMLTASGYAALVENVVNKGKEV
ncbi:MAG TPA: hypothetical protein VND83_01550 [Acidimicrobiales bacterium]|nr:hypothetical protein [Acidimicrobiales bacterium]